VIRATTRHISPFSREQLFLNRRVALLASVIGRAYFAYCGDAEREFLLKIAEAGPPDSPDTAIAAEPQRVQELIETVRSLGYAIGQPDPLGPYRSLAIPIMGARPGDDILGSMVLFWYASVMNEHQAAQRYLGPFYELAGAIAEGVSVRLAGLSGAELRHAELA